MTGYIIDRKYMMVEIKIAEAIDRRKILSCPTYKIKDGRVIFSSNTILERATFLHDCKGGRCKIVERFITEKIEQENISKKKEIFKA